MSYPFFLTPGFDDFRCQSETGWILHTFVHLAETTPLRRESKDKSHISVAGEKRASSIITSIQTIQQLGKTVLW